MTDASPAAVYRSSPINRKHRATQADMSQRRLALYQIVADMRPMTVRQIFYQATVQGIVEKAEAGYDKVATALVRMRRNPELREVMTGRLIEPHIPYEWIVDHTRRPRQPYTCNGIEDALRDTLAGYRKALWSNHSDYVEVWIEKEALLGVVEPVTEEYDVPLMPARGYASLSFLYEAAENIRRIGRPTYIYHFGDYDPSGVDAADNIERQLRELAPDAEIHFERVAVTTAQITRWALPTRPTKSSDARAKKFGSDISVELDAIDPNRLRDLVRGAINRHMSEQQLRKLQRVEQEERQRLRQLIYSIAAA